MTGSICQAGMTDVALPARRPRERLSDLAPFRRRLEDVEGAMPTGELIVQMGAAHPLVTEN